MSLVPYDTWFVILCVAMIAMVMLIPRSKESAEY